MEEPLRNEAITGLTDGQLAELAARVHARVGDLRSGGRPYALGPFRSVAMVVALMRNNVTQELAGASSGSASPR